LLRLYFSLQVQSPSDWGCDLKLADTKQARHITEPSGAQSGVMHPGTELQIPLTTFPFKHRQAPLFSGWPKK
jgi:hypothetical protein